MKNFYMLAAFVLFLLAGCIKTDPQTLQTDNPEPDGIPDTVMFVNTYDKTTGTTLHVLNAATGSSFKKYSYPADPNTTWSYPVAGNGVLYTLQSNKINAIDPLIGTIKWTDNFDNTLTPVLHGDRFYGAYKVNGTSHKVFALDATQQSNNFVWTYQLAAAPTQVKYDGGKLYVLTDAMHLIVLDAITGTLKLSLNNLTPISLTAVQHNVILGGNCFYDATTGANLFSTYAGFTPSLFEAADPIAWVTEELFFLRSDISYGENTRKTMLNAYDRSGDNTPFLGPWKWATKYDGYRLIINSAGGRVSQDDTLSKVEYIWNKKLVSRSRMGSYSGVLQPNGDLYSMIDILTGTPGVKLDDIQGNTVESFIVSNTLYLFKTKTSSTAGSYLLAIDLATGKRRWMTDKPLAGYTGNAFSCVSTLNKAYSPYIQ